MSRSGYSDDIDNWALIRWRGAVASAFNGKRGQAFFKETVAALDNLPEKKLEAQTLEAHGQYCTLGAVMHSRGLPIPENADQLSAEEVAQILNISHAQAAEIIYMNDDDGYWRRESPEDRWKRMREWAAAQIKELTQ